MGMIPGIGVIALCLVMVCSAIVARRRAGQPMARYALIWAGLVMLGFAVALAIDRHAS